MQESERNLQNYIERTIIPLTNQWNKVSLLTIHQHIKIMMLVIWKNDFESFALIVPPYPIFQRQVSPTHPEWKESTDVTAFCLLSVTEKRKLLQKNGSIARNLQRQQRKRTRYLYYSNRNNSKNCFWLLADLSSLPSLSILVKNATDLYPCSTYNSNFISTKTSTVLPRLLR